MTFIFECATMRAMKKHTPLTIIERYSRLSGDQKIRLGLSLSATARRIHQDGMRAIEKANGKRPSTTA